MRRRRSTATLGTCDQRQQRPSTTAGDIIDAVRRLTPAISCRAPEIEAARRLPDDLFADLKEAGCLRMLLPRSHRGLGMTLPDAMRVYEALARADASVAWTVANCFGAWRELAGLPAPPSTRCSPTPPR